MMALFLALTLFQHLIDGFHNRDLRQLVTDLLGVTASEYTTSQMTYDLRRLRLKALIFGPGTNRYFVTRRMAGRWPACSHASKLVYSDPPLPCSPAMTPSCLSCCGHLLIASTTNLIN